MPDCYTPWEQLVHGLGGPQAFIAIITGLVGLIAVVFIACWVARARKKEVSEVDRVSPFAERAGFLLA
jgi:hypothetical protein